MQNQRTRKRILGIVGIESESRLETGMVIGMMILFAVLAVMAAVVIDMQARP